MPSVLDPVVTDRLPHRLLQVRRDHVLAQVRVLRGGGTVVGKQGSKDTLRGKIEAGGWCAGRHAVTMVQTSENLNQCGFWVYRLCGGGLVVSCLPYSMTFLLSSASHLNIGA